MTILDRIELRPNGLRMILSLVPLTPAAAPPTPLAWLRNAPTGPKPDHVRALLDRLRRVREIGMTRDFLSPFGRNRRYALFYAFCRLVLQCHMSHNILTER
jgi:hypothetical protein